MLETLNKVIEIAKYYIIDKKILLLLKIEYIEIV